MLKYKDTITNICGLLVALSGSIVTIEKGGVAVPTSISHAAIIAGTLAIVTIGYFTGKTQNPS